ncbi:glutaredoxin [Reinekea sp.]|jgi:glutaredoxin-related protein|uniref:glutaredoxin n=1 Tax=Reinekea sp. TaxID=1970455 RepID=UPI002A82FB62|nr:glutaredoxin [Reinekea sp.]
MRPILDQNLIHPAIHAQLGGDQSLLNNVKDAIGRHPVVVVGMKQNPVVKSTRKLLDEQQVDYCYLEYGGYLSKWRERLAIKMWTGFVTFPQIFINGVLMGGYTDLKALVDAGELKVLLPVAKARV